MLKYLPLLTLLPRRLESLTLAELEQVKTVLGVTVEVTQELKEAAVSLLQGRDMNLVSDLINDPESIAQLTKFFTDQTVRLGSDGCVVRCPHCQSFHVVR